MSLLQAMRTNKTTNLSSVIKVKESITVDYYEGIPPPPPPPENYYVKRQITVSLAQFRYNCSLSIGERE